MQSMREGLQEANDKLDDICDTLARMSGGKKAVFAMFTVVGAVIATIGVIVSTIINLWPRLG